MQHSVDATIDYDNLEREFLEHPSKVMYINDDLSDAIYERDELKGQLKRIEADLFIRVTNEWEKHFNKAPTEGLKNHWVSIQPSHKRISALLNRAEHKVNFLKGRKDAMESRGYSIGYAVNYTIHGMNSEVKIRKVDTDRKRVNELKNQKPKSFRLKKGNSE